MFRTQTENVTRKEVPLYEEIGEVHVESFMYTQNILYGISSSAGGCTVPQVHHHQCEDVKPEVSQSTEVFLMEQCSAYT